MCLANYYYNATIEHSVLKHFLTSFSMYHVPEVLNSSSVEQTLIEYPGAESYLIVFLVRWKLRQPIHFTGRTRN
jgi:hypothetical protein